MVWERFSPMHVTFLPCAQSPLKKARPVASDTVRLRCLRQGLRGIPWAEVSDWEIRQKGPSYSIQAVQHWKNAYPGIALDWILGSDQWKQIRSWRNYRELGKQVRFLVFPRPDQPRPMRGFTMETVPMRLDISASEIRKRLRLGTSIKGMVLAPVERIVRQTGSYRR